MEYRQNLEANINNEDAKQTAKKEFFMEDPDRIHILIYFSNKVIFKIIKKELILQNQQNIIKEYLDAHLKM